MKKDINSLLEDKSGRKDANSTTGASDDAQLIKDYVKRFFRPTALLARWIGNL